MTSQSASMPPAQPRVGSAHGVATYHASGELLDAWFPVPGLTPLSDDALAAQVRGSLAALETQDQDRDTRRTVISVESSLDQAPASAEDAWLRLHLLSHRLVTPNSINLDGVFGLLTNVVWTSAGPCSTKNFELTRALLLARGPLNVFGVDKFPRMVDYVLPAGVRIADADRVRLGAHLAPGTTVMHEGFVNFNAGTLGASMVEGRISASVVVGDGTDVGGGASIMGTLSGGGTQRISLGERVLLGANSGVGISLGDDCVVEAGLYVTAGTRVQYNGRTVKALELSGASHLLYRRNSTSGAVEALPRSTGSVELNEALHAN